MRALALPLMLAFVGAPALAKADKPLSPFAQFQQREGQLFDIGWQLARANSAFCPSTESSIGLMVHDAANYARAHDLRTTLSLAGDIGVQAVASGSPAERAGVEVNNTLLAIDVTEVEQRWKPTRPTVQRTLQIEAAIAGSLGDGRVGLSFNDQDGETMIEGVETCTAKFRLTGDDVAYASKETVFFGEGFMGFGLPRKLFAAAVAHELAHVIQGHALRKESEGWGWRETRASEREADRMMPWLLFNAGYDPEAAADWMRAWGPKHSGGLLRKRTHDGWDERLAMIVNETAALQRLVAARNWQPGEADWSKRFPAAPIK